MRHSRPPTKHELSYRPRLGSVQPPSTQLRAPSYAHSHALTYTHRETQKHDTHKSKWATKVVSFPPEAGPVER